MSLHTCPHEREVLDLVAIDQWPQRVDAALRSHVAECASCAEVASIATAVREWGDGVPAVRRPEASVVWHRAQLRARAEAARAASRPVWVAQGFALVALIVALVWIGPSANWYASVWQRLSGSASLGTVALPPGWGWSVSLAVGGVVLLLSLVIGALGISERSEIPNSK